MIDFASVAEVEAAFDNVCAPYVCEVVDVLDRGEIAIVAEEGVQRIRDGIVQSERLGDGSRETGIDEGISEAIEADD